MRHQPRHRAFTLTEVLIVISILGLLAAASYPIYRDQVRKMRRTDARQSLMRVAQEMERCYSRYRRYDHPQCPLVVDGPRIAAVSNGGYYRISSSSPGGSTSLTSETFILYAMPQGKQAGDTRCAVFQYSNTSAYAATNAAGSDVTRDCW